MLLPVKCRGNGENYTRKVMNKNRSQVFRELSAVSCVVLLVFPQAATCSDTLHFAASMAMSVFFLK